MVMEAFGFMHVPGSGRYPTSRDWNFPTVECGMTDCVANHSGTCVMPCRICIRTNGKCGGYRKRGKEKK